MLDHLETGNGKRKLSLKVMSFNIHNGINWDQKYGLEQMADFIGEVTPDLAGLQEVSRFWSRKTNYQDMVNYFEQRLGMYPVFAPSLCRERGALFGNLVLSKFPIINAWSEMLPSKLEPRNCLAAQVIAFGTRFNFLTTHLGLSGSDRLAQVRTITKLGLQLGGPLIICGDFNESPTGPGVTLIKENWVKHDPTPPQGTMRLSVHQLGPEIDMIFTSHDLVSQNLKVYENKLSDHLPVFGEFEMDLSWEQVAGEPVYLS
mgnify:CR=1 FL=1